MGRNVGTSAGLVALLAVLLHLQRPPSSESSGSGSERANSAAASEQKKASARAKDETGTKKSEDEPIEGPWLATQAYFHKASSLNWPYEDVPSTTRNCSVVAYSEIIQGLSTVGENAAKDNLCLAELLGLPEEKKRARMWSIVATVPDPLHTRMGLYMDGQIESIERSLSSAGWEFAGQWMPWIDGAGVTGNDVNEWHKQRRLQRVQEEMPGILIFRSKLLRPEKLIPPEILFVFVVPERATGGIAGPPFHVAMRLTQILRSPDHPVGLLSPTYSGSFASLAMLVKEWRDIVQFAPTVYSGSASNAKYAEIFVGAVNDGKPAGTGMSFRAGIVATEDYVQIACNVLKDFHIPVDRAVLLKEDESGFSQSFDREKAETCSNLAQLVFPRDISHLRNAYQESTSAAVRDPYGDRAPSLGFSIRDPNSGEDSIPTFSNTQTPLVQDAILASITRELDRDGTRLVFIGAANALDTLFLMRLVRRNCPDARILLENPNVLYVAAAAHDPLTGTLLLSTYPMFRDGEDWLHVRAQGDPPLNPMMFPESTLQGVFNVTQFLLNDIGAIRPDQGPHLRGYGQWSPGGAGKPYPAVWLLSMTSGGFLPVNYYYLPERHVTKFLPGPDKPPGGIPADFTPLRSWCIAVLLLDIAVLCGCYLLVSRNAHSAIRKPVWLLLSDAYRLRHQSLLCAVLGLTGLEFVLVVPGFTTLWKLAHPLEHPFYFVLAPLAMVSLVAPLGSYLWILKLRWPEQVIWANVRSARAGVVFCLFASLVFLGVAVVWAMFCYGYGTSSFFFRYRSMDLFSRASPAATMAVLCLIVFVVSMFYFKRYTSGGSYRPLLDCSWEATDSEQARGFQEKMDLAYKAVHRQIIAPRDLGGAELRTRYGVAVILVIACFGILGRFEFAFEQPYFNWLLLVPLLGMVLLWMAIACYDFVVLWKRLEKLIGLIEIYPADLQNAIRRLARDWPRQPIWRFRQSVSSSSLSTQMMYALHRRSVLLAQHGDREKAKEAQKDLKHFSDVSGVTSVKSDALDSRLQNQKLSATLAAKILKNDLRPIWRHTLNDERLHRPGVPLTEEEMLLSYGSDFVALHFCRYIVWGVEHVRREASCVTATFVLLLVFFQSYSPQGPQVVARFLAGVLALIGFLIIRVYAQMERNRMLSRISRTVPGALGRDFWVQLLTMGGLPLLGVVAHLFPSVSQFLFQWIAPGIQGGH